MHALRKLKSEIRIHDKCHAALTGLAVDTNDRFVFPAEIARIDRQIWHGPFLLVSLMQRLNALVDRVLMGAGKSGKNKFSGVRVAHIHIHFIASLIHINDLIHILDLQFRIDPL